jgi:uncharacterized protein
MNSFLHKAETPAAALIGGLLFTMLNLPLAWMLGPLTAVFLWQHASKKKLPWHPVIKEIGLVTLGISFGLYFTSDVLEKMVPYIIPYIGAALILIASSIAIGLLISKCTKLLPATSVFGTIPGGLTEMVIASEELKAAPSQVLIFQTVRLLIVLFVVPYMIVFIFSSSGTPEIQLPSGDGISFWTYQTLFFFAAGLMGYRLRNLLPAGIMIIPLLLTVGMMLSPVSLPAVPEILFYGAQLAVGTALGKSISYSDIKKAGKYSGLFAAAAAAIIVIASLLGSGLYFITDMDLVTALLSTAPGGLIEMVLTASITGADPAVVTSLQLLRILIIIIFVPIFLKKFLSRG